MEDEGEDTQFQQSEIEVSDLEPNDGAMQVSQALNFDNGQSSHLFE